MLTEFDDYFIHQTVDTIDHVASTDPRFQDRLYFNVHGTSDAFLLNLGIGAFPNQNAMDGYICAVRGTRQYNLRVARPLNHDRVRIFAGPLHLDILEPLKRWRLRLEPNQSGIAFDLVFDARTLPLEHHPIFQRHEGYVVWHQQHLQQSGTYTGWVEIAGERMPAEDLWGSRDRTWGVRGPQPGTTLDTATAPRAVAGLWMSAQLPSFAVHCWAGKDAQGRDLYLDGALAAVGSGVPLKHFKAWSYEVRRDERHWPIETRLAFTDEDGTDTRLTVRPTNLAINLVGTGYAAGFFGQKRAAVHVEGESWDVSDPETRKTYGLLGGDVLSQFECDGETGWGVFESQLMAVRE